MMSIFCTWRLRFLLVAVSAVPSSSSAIVAPNFSKMRVKELRAYLSARHTECFGCREKHEFVSKAQEACEASSGGLSCKVDPKIDKKPRPEAKRKSTKSKPQAKAGTTTNRKARAPPQLAPGDHVLEFTLLCGNHVLGLSLLFGMLVTGLWRCVRCVRRRCFQLRKQKSLCPITLHRIVDPYKLPCCRHVCERQAIGKWMASSKYFRRRNDAQLERVAACPLCRTMLEPTHVRSLLNDLRMAAPIDGEFAFDSGIYDAAFPTFAMHRNFILLKTKDDLDQDIQQPAAPSAQEAGDESCKSNSESPTGLVLHEHSNEPSEVLGLESERVGEPEYIGFRRGFLL